MLWMLVVVGVRVGAWPLLKATRVLLALNNPSHVFISLSTLLSLHTVLVFMSVPLVAV